MMEPENKNAVVAVLSIAAALMVATIVAPVYAAFSSRAAHTQAALAELGQVRARLAERPALEGELKQAQATLAVAPGLVPAQKLPLAQQQLQNEIKALVESESGAIESSQVLPIDNRSGFSVIALRYDLTVPASKLATLAYRIETHQPYLFIGDASVTCPDSLDRGQADTPEPRLEVRWTIRAYMEGMGA